MRDLGKTWALAEGLADYWAEREHEEALADVRYWATEMADPCCEECRDWYYTWQYDQALGALVEMEMRDGLWD